MRNEIEKLCETLERLEPMNCSVQGVVQKLRRILDADPIADIRAMLAEPVTRPVWIQHLHGLNHWSNDARFKTCPYCEANNAR